MKPLLVFRGIYPGTIASEMLLITCSLWVPYIDWPTQLFVISKRTKLLSIHMFSSHNSWWVLPFPHQVPPPCCQEHDLNVFPAVGFHRNSCNELQCFQSQGGRHSDASCGCHRIFEPLLYRQRPGLAPQMIPNSYRLLPSPIKILCSAWYREQHPKDVGGPTWEDCIRSESDFVI